MSVSARRYRVKGRVQGVGFRYWTRIQAQEIGIRGRVRNLSDGSVEVSAIGTEDQLSRLEKLLSQGPPSSTVSEVLSTPDELWEAEGFVIET